jgi:uncharacterized protein (TIGR04141 family)
MQKVKQRLLTFHCFHPQINTIHRAKKFLDEGVGEPKEIQITGVENAQLFLPEPSQSPPPWAQLLVPYTKEIATIRNRSHSAIVLLPVSEHIFAITFGRAAHFIKGDKLVRNFGLRTVVNAVAADSLRSVDMKTFESMAIHRRIQASAQSSIGQFGIDWTRDLLRAVTGKPIDPSFGARASGADALVLAGRHTLEDTPALCNRALEYYNSDNYKETPWRYIDFLQPEYDPEIIAQLDMKLASAILDPELMSPPYLAIDDILDYTGVIGFAIKPSKRHFTAELEIDTLRNFILQHCERTPVEWIRTGSILVKFSDTATTSPRHRIYKSLDWSTRHNDRLYRFTSGLWLRVDQEFAERLRSEIALIREPSRPLPPAPEDIMESRRELRHGEKGEGLYIKMTTQQPFDFLAMHPNTFKSDIMNEELEPCDILGIRGALYYIKRGGKSGGLSHLFAQGRAACITLLKDAGYRRLVRGAIPKAVSESTKDPEEQQLLAEEYSTMFPDSGIDPASLEVCFIVIRKSNRNWPNDLPYISQITLYDVSRQLREANFDVRLQCVTPAKTASDPPRRRSKSLESGAVSRS